MGSIVAAALTRSVSAGVVKLQTTLTLDDQVIPLEFEAPESLAPARTNRGDLIVAPAMLIAMRHGARLRLSDSVSPSLLRNLETFAQVFATWYPESLTRVELDVPIGRDRKPARSARGRVGQCFTGGIDSLYSLLRAERKPHILINALGMDVVDPRRKPTADPTPRLTMVAERHGSELALVRTNLKKAMLNSGLTWGGMAHGAALASLGYLLSGSFETFVIPATHSYRTAQPWGSSPWTDPLLSSRQLTVVHHGAEYDRVGKTQLIAREPDVRDALRVCLKFSDDVNCGECRKCVRTMLALELFDVLAHSNRLPRRLDPDVVNAVTLTNSQDVQHIIDFRDHAAALGTRPDLEELANAMIERSQDAIAAMSNA